MLVMLLVNLSIVFLKTPAELLTSNSPDKKKLEQTPFISVYVQNFLRLNLLSANWKEILVVLENFFLHFKLSYCYCILKQIFDKFTSNVIGTKILTKWMGFWLKTWVINKSQLLRQSACNLSRLWSLEKNVCFIRYLPYACNCFAYISLLLLFLDCICTYKLNRYIHG